MLTRLHRDPTTHKLFRPSSATHCQWTQHETAISSGTKGGWAEAKAQWKVRGKSTDNHKLFRCQRAIGYDAHVLRLHWFSSTGTPSESWEKQLVAVAPDHSSDDEPNPEQMAENQEKTQLLAQFRAEQQQQQQQQQESFIIPASVSLSGKDCLHEFKGELLVDCLHEFKAELLVDEMMDDWVSPSPLSGISLCISLPL